MQLGDTVNLIHRMNGELMPVELTKILTTSSKPMVEVRWKNDRVRYKLDLDKKEVHAIDATPHRRYLVKAWFAISEDHRIALIDLFWITKKKGR